MCHRITNQWVVISYLESVQLSDPGYYLVIWINDLIPYPERHVRNPSKWTIVVRRVQAKIIIVLYFIIIYIYIFVHKYLHFQAKTKNERLRELCIW